MPPPPALAPFTDADYESIAAAVLETARGRWFLTEYARRNRHSDTKIVLEAIEKLERMIAQRAEGPEPDRVRVDLVEMMEAITRTKNEIASIRPAPDSANHFDQASSELDAIVGTTEKATSDILAAAERVQEIAWTLREQGVDAAVCDLIDSNAAEVYSACSFQDLTGQRIRKVIEVLRFLEARIDAMIKIWRLDDLEFVSADDARLMAAPARHPAATCDGLQQQAVDEIIGAERKQDVFWRETRIQEGRDPRNLGEFDLDDLEVFETAPDAQPPLEPDRVHTGSNKTAVETPASSAAPEQPEKSGGNSPGKSDCIEGLSFADRMALFA
ncbi:MAG: chemotaxis protein [Xanthobacteraceae bacterium]